MINVTILDKLLNKIKMKTGIEKFDDTKTLISKGNTLADEVTLKNVVILIRCIKKKV